MARPGMIGSGSYARGEMSGDKRHFGTQKINTLTLLKRLWTYLGRNQLLLVLAVILAVTSSVLSLLGPKLSGAIINIIEQGKGHVNFDRIIQFALLLLICYTTAAILSYLLRVVIQQLSRNVSKQMRHDVFQNMSALPVSFFDRFQTGDLISVISYDIDTVNQSLSSDLLSTLQTIVTIAVSLSMMLSIAPWLTLIFLVTIPITFLFIRWLSSRIRPFYRKRGIMLGQLNGFVEEMLSGQKTLRAYGREGTIMEKFDEKNNAAVDAYITAESNGVLTVPFVLFINNLSLTLVCVFGSIAYIKGSIGLGDLSAFVQYSKQFSGPINEMANVIAELQSAAAAAERVFSLIDAEPETADAPDATTLAQVTGDIELRDVDFSYIPGTPIIKDLNFHAEPGSLTAIVGPTGAGKTTIINLLMRFYDVDKGGIYMDGQEIRTITRDSLRKAYSMVLQDTWLFQGTIFENIAYGKPDATMEQVVQAAKAAHIHSYISRLPKGYDTVLSDNGTSISKGQKQMLTIARAMLLDTHILILDEATSNVDTRTEQHIQAAMRNLMKGKTCFVIAHRLSTIRSADHILVLDGGQVVEQGSHESLMAQKGFYYRLYQAQFDSVS